MTPSPRARNTKFVKWVERAIGDVLPPKAGASNPATKAIGSRLSDSAFFRRCFGHRLLRLKTAFSADQAVYQTILSKIAAVGTTKWSGVWAELVAYDFLSSFTRVVPEVAPTEPMLAARMGRGTPILDGMLPSYLGLYFDVKRLGDVTREILAGITSRLEKEFPDVQLAAEFPQHIDPDEMGRHRDAIFNGLRAALASNESGFSLPKVGLCVRIYKPRRDIVTTVHRHDPYRQADARKYAAIEDAHQLLEDRPNLRIFVTHPWYDQTNRTNFSGGRTTFFRSLARRVFCELSNDERPSDQVLPRGGSANVTVAEIAKRVSAILFIVDETVAPKHSKVDAARPGDIMSGFLFLNPNAKARPEAEMEFARFIASANKPRLLSLVDDFRFDNY